MPIAVPRMPASASGVSMTRSSPKSFCRPSVTRKTPPSLPMSSPMRTTLGSLLHGGAQAAGDALGEGGGGHQLASLERRLVALELGPLALDAAGAARRRRGRTCRCRAGRAGPGSARAPRRRARRTPPRRRRRRRRRRGRWSSSQRLSRSIGSRCFHDLDLGRDAVLGGVVGGGVRAHPVGVGLDEGRALAGAGGVERRLGDGVDGEHVVAVDPDAGEAEAAARGATAGRGSASRWARRSPTGCSGRRRRPGCC